MFHLLQSIGMLAAAGVVIPVIIHFWNRKQGKTLRVGSISLLTSSYKQQAKSLQLQELFLLLLRSILIVLVAFLLSKPVWQQQLNPDKQRGWVLMEKRRLQQTYTRFKPVIDSLIKQHYEFHYFDTGFEKGNLENILKNNKDTPVQNTFAYWPLLSSLDQQVPATLPVYLFTTNSLQRFSGSRSQVAMNLHWQTYTPEDSVSKWLAQAYLTTADSIRLVAATSEPSGTVYAYKNVPVVSQQSSEYNIQTGSKNLSVSFQNSTPVIVDTASLTVTIFTVKYNNDAAYLKAAIEAIQQFTKRKIKLTLVNNSANIPGQQDWIFWLTDDPVSSVDGKNIFVYEKGKGETVASSILTSNRAADTRQLSLYKRIPFTTNSPDDLQTIWQDGFGEPVLQLKKGKASVYYFFSRFDPSWSDLPWSNTFPLVIYDLIRNNQNSISEYDNRIMDDQQVQPISSAEIKDAAKEKFMETHDLSPIFWGAAFVVFFAERIIALRTKKEK